MTRRNNTIPDICILRAHFDWCDLVVDCNVCGMRTSARDYVSGGIINVIN